MQKQSFVIQYDYPNFWEYSANGSDEQTLLDVSAMDKLANGYRWSMSVQGSGQRKPHCRSGMTLSLHAMLPVVAHELKNDPNAKVYVLTPDVELLFIC